MSRSARSARSLRGIILASIASGASGASIAACTPATFDNLTGGQKPAPASTDEGAGAHQAAGGTDATIPPPRPIAPVSVSWINSNRPHFQWANARDIPAAIIEVSSTRDFKKLDYVFRPTGTDFTPDTDIAPGFWFWRLRGRTATADGPVPTAKGVVWEMLVRGPSASKVASSAPTGGIVDINADGAPDLVFTAQLKDPTSPGDIDYAYYLLLGEADAAHSYSYNGQDSSQIFILPSLLIDIAGGTDVDGDGYGDLAIGGLEPLVLGGTPTISDMWIHYGSPTAFDADKAAADSNYIAAPKFAAPPILNMAGDMNGDGYGDVAVSLSDVAFTAFGASQGLPSLEVFAIADAKTPALPFAAGADLDGDGLTDVALSSAIPGSPIAYTLGSKDRFTALKGIKPGDILPPPQATAVATGDFDGDGAGDIAFTTVVAGAAAVCVYSPQVGPLEGKNCWSSTAAVSGFGLSLAAGDLDADGRDDLVVGSTSGIITLQEDATGAFTATPVTGQFQPKVTMIYPGRPEFARWAAVSADGLSITVFQGTAVHQVIPLSSNPSFIKAGATLR